MKKILLVLLICFLVLCNSNNVYADDTFVVLLPEFPYYNTTDYPFYYIRKFDNGSYNLYHISSDYVISDGTYLYFNGEFRYCSYNPSTNPDSNQWSEWSDYKNGSSWSTQICPLNLDMSNNNIVYSNFDIKYNGTLLRSKLEYNSSGFTEVEDDTLTLSGFISNLASFFSTLFDNLGNWFLSIFNAIISLPQLLFDGLSELLKFLFVPSEDFLDEILNCFEDRFGFILHIRDFFEVINNESYYNGVPKFTIKYGGKTYNVIDFSMFENYKSFIRNISSFIMIFYTWLWIVKNGSSLIGNGVASSDSNEI